MSNLDPYELEVLSAFEGGRLKSVATKREIDKLKAAAKALRPKTGESISVCRLLT